MVRAVSVGKLSSYRERAQISDVQISLMAEDEGPKQDLSQKLCCFGLQTARCGVPESRWPPRNVRQKPPGLCGHLCSDQERGRFKMIKFLTFPKNLCFHWPFFFLINFIASRFMLA